MGAAAAIVVAVAASLAVDRARSQALFRAICEDHAKYVTAQSQFQSSDATRIEGWFQNKIDFGIRIPSLKTADLLGARLCILKERRAALIFYKTQGRPVSLFQLNARDVPLGGIERSVIDGASIWRMSHKGFAAAAFERRGVVSVLVSDLRESDLLQLASAARESAAYR